MLGKVFEELVTGRHESGSYYTPGTNKRPVVAFMCREALVRSGRTHIGSERLAQITGMNVNTIRRGRRELNDDLAGRPTDRVRKPGGGRPALEKKVQL